MSAPLDLPTSVCDASDMLTAFVVKISDALKDVDVLSHMATVQESVVAGTMADVTMVLTGAVLILLPVFFSSKWIETVTIILSILFGIMGASYIVETQPSTAALVDNGAAAVGLDGELKCSSSIAIILVVALLFAWLMQKVKPIFYAVSGGLGAGAGAYIASGLVVPIMSTQFGIDVDGMYVFVAAGLIAVLGSYAFFQAGESILDLVIGLVGCVLVARGGVNFLVGTSWVPAGAQLEAWYSYYVSGLAALLLLVRYLLVRCRDNKDKKVTTPAAKSPVKGKGRPGTKVAPSPPPSRGRPGGPPKGKSGKAMY